MGKDSNKSIKCNFWAESYLRPAEHFAIFVKAFPDMSRARFSILLAILFFPAVPGSAQTYVFAGDSITDGGWGASGGRGIPTAQRNLTDLNHIYGHSYMMLVASDWQSAFPANGLAFHNRGLSGDTLAGLAARWDADIIALKPDILSVLVGVNDSAQAINLKAWEADYRALLARTREALPGCRLVLCTPFLAPVGRFGTREDYPERAARVKEMAAAVRELAAEFQAVLVPFDELFASLPAGATPDWWIWDGIHPTAAGHRRMADLWEQTVGAPAVQPVLPPSSSETVNDEDAPARVTVSLPGGKAPAAPAGPYEATWESLAEHYRIPEWFEDAKFGIFMHWGVYTVPAAGSEWYPKHMYNGMLKHHTEKWGNPKEFGYKDFIPLFRAEQYDPAAWAALFEEAGAKYAVLTAEHHDGFAMYDSDLTEWDAVDKGPHRDLLGDLAKAVRARGMKFGISNHRIENWDFMYPAGTKEHDLFDPAYAGLYGPPQKPSAIGSAMGPGKDAEGRPAHPQSDAFLEEWLARAEEIVDKYQPDLYYFDNGVNSRSLDPWKLRFAQYYYNSAAQWGKAVSIQTKSDAYLAGSIKDYERESRAPKEIETPCWQVDDPIGHKFGYVEGLQLQKPGNVIRSLVENISKGGNLCLNISPKADGTIPDDQQAVLRAVGAWLRTNGDGAYGTRAWTVFGEGDAWRFTCKGPRVVYAFALADGRPAIAALGRRAGRVERVEQLGGGAVRFRQTAGSLQILDSPAGQEGITVFKITLK